MRFILRVPQGTAAAAKQAAHPGAGRRGTLHEFHVVPGLQLVDVGNGRVRDAADSYLTNPNVLYAEPDYVIELFADPDDPQFASGAMWGSHNTGQIVEENGGGR